MVWTIYAFCSWYIFCWTLVTNLLLVHWYLWVRMARWFWCWHWYFIHSDQLLKLRVRSIIKMSNRRYRTQHFILFSNWWIWIEEKFFSFFGWRRLRNNFFGLRISKEQRFKISFWWYLKMKAYILKLFWQTHSELLFLT